MFSFFKVSKSLLLLLFFLPIMTGASFYLYKEYTKTTAQIYDITYENLVNEKSVLIHNFIQYMQEDLGQNALSEFYNSAELRAQYERKFRMLMTPEVKYLYMLHYEKDGKDKNGFRLHYTLDTAIEEDEKAFYNQKFDPESDIWEKVKATRQEQVQQLIHLDTLWITLVIPILEDGEVVAAIGADFANETRNTINDVINPMETFFFYFSVFMLIMLVAAYVQFVLYYTTNRRGLVDPLTKIYNRQYLTGFLKHLKLTEYQILMLDIDHFKKVNDTYGHDVGDVVLKAVSARVSSVIRRDDAFIRYGGEEFLLLLHKKDPLKGIQVAQRIIDIIHKQPISVGQHTISVSVSIGINPVPYKAKDFDAAIKIADEQLYHAKANGRNRFEVFETKPPAL